MKPVANVITANRCQVERCAAHGLHRMRGAERGAIGLEQRLADEE